MLKNLSLPTDNLYKFVTVLALGTLLFSISSKYSILHSYELRKSILELKRDSLLVNVGYLENELLVHKDFITLNTISNTNEIVLPDDIPPIKEIYYLPKKDITNDHSDILKQLNLICYNLSNAQVGLITLDAQVKRKKNIVEISLSILDKIKFCSLVVLLISVLFWYFKFQRVQDNNLQNSDGNDIVIKHQMDKPINVNIKN